jgi:hypothetical protein
LANFGLRLPVFDPGIRVPVIGSKKAVALKMPGLRKSGEEMVVKMTLGASSHWGRNFFTAIIRDLTSHARG